MFTRLSYPLFGYLLGCFFLWTGSSFSATPTDQQLESIQRQQEQLLRQNQKQLQERERLRKLKELEPKEKEQSEDQSVLPASGTCLDVKSISLAGADTTNTSSVRRVLRQYEGKCLVGADIQNLMTALNEAFQKGGYVTTKAYLEPQDLANGILKITVVEGVVEDLIQNEGTNWDQVQVFLAFPTSPGDVLNLRDIEQGLDQQNRLPSNNAKMQLQPGTDSGDTLVNITNEQGNRLRGEVGYNNTGSSSTGREQYTMAASMDNLFSLNDMWSVTYSRTARNHDYKRRSRSISGTVSVPYGYSTLTYSGSLYEYSTEVEGAVDNFVSDGLSRTHKVELSHVLHRDQISKTRLDLSVTYKNSLNYVDESLVEASSRKLAIGRIALAHSTRLWGGVLSGEAGIDHGLRILGALRDTDGQASSSPKAKFRKWTLEANYQRPFKVWDQKLNWTSNTSWIYAPDTLYGSERIGIGGQYSVRGFRNSSISGDQGGYWRNELAWRLPQPNLGELNPVIGRIEPFVAFDWGQLVQDPNEENEKGTMTGWAIGLRNSAKNSRFELLYSQPTNAPSFISKPKLEVLFNATLKF